MKQQRCEIRRFAEFFNAADKNGVVTCRVDGFVGNLESRTAILKQRRATRPRLPWQTGETINWPGGKAVGELFLINRQNIDRMMRCFVKATEVVRVIVETPEDECRLKGNRREGIDGEAYRLTVRVDGGNDGDASGEAPKGVAQGTGVGLLLVHRGLAARKRPYYPDSHTARRE